MSLETVLLFGLRFRATRVSYGMYNLCDTRADTGESMSHNSQGKNLLRYSMTSTNTGKWSTASGSMGLLT